jgi:hypothetical protein
LDSDEVASVAARVFERAIANWCSVNLKRPGGKSESDL